MASSSDQAKPRSTVRFLCSCLVPPALLGGLLVGFILLVTQFGETDLAVRRALLGGWQSVLHRRWENWGIGRIFGGICLFMLSAACLHLVLVRFQKNRPWPFKRSILALLSFLCCIGGGVCLTAIGHQIYWLKQRPMTQLSGGHMSFLSGRSFFWQAHEESAPVSQLVQHPIWEDKDAFSGFEYIPPPKWCAEDANPIVLVARQHDFPSSIGANYLGFVVHLRRPEFAKVAKAEEIDDLVYLSYQPAAGARP